MIRIFFFIGSNSINLAMISFVVIAISSLLCTLNQHNNLSSNFKVDGFLPDPSNLYFLSPELISSIY